MLKHLIDSNMGPPSAYLRHKQTNLCIKFAPKVYLSYVGAVLKPPGWARPPEHLRFCEFIEFRQLGQFAPPVSPGNKMFSFKKASSLSCRVSNMFNHTQQSVKHVQHQVCQACSLNPELACRIEVLHLWSTYLWWSLPMVGLLHS